MSKIRLPFVQRWVDQRHGAIRVRHYFRKPGFKRVQLPGLPGSPEFMGAYQAAMAGESAPPIVIAADRSKPGTIAALVASYLSSAAFLSSKSLTQSTYRNILERVRKEHGEKPVRLIEQHHVEAMFAKKAATPAAANHWLRLVKTLFDSAVAQKLRLDNPAARVKPLKRQNKNVVEDGFHTWTEDELATYEARHPIGSKARLAYGLMLFTAQRISDAVKMGRPHLLRHKATGRRMIKVRQQKTGQYMAIPMHPRLATILDTIPATQLTFLMTAYGKAHTADGLGNQMREWCDQAGLPQCTAHGLRKAACRRLAEAGCSEKQIAAISGHTDMRVLAAYVKMADQARLAIDATDKVVALFEAPGAAVVDAENLAAETVADRGQRRAPVA